MKMARDEEFRDYVLGHRGDLVRTATLFAAGNHHLAEDVVQATLTRLYVGWPAFQRVDNRRAYVRRAMVNALIDEQRRPWRRERSTHDLPDRPAPEPATSARVDQLNQALSELPPRMRAAVVLRYFEDLSVADTAEALGCSQGTVKSQTARALDKLRFLLEAPPTVVTLAPATPASC